MFDGKFIATLFAIAVSIFAICNFNTKKITSHEGFGFGNLPSTTYRKERMCADNQREADKGNFYTVPPNYQMNVNYGAHVRYDMPNRIHQSSSCDPLTFGGMARENFTTGSKESFHTDEHINNNYNEFSGQSDQYPDVSAMVPVGDMSSPNALGEHTNAICYDRLIYANRRSRLKGQGCLIRGDLPIKTQKHGWFSVSADANDLQQGALAVIGGKTNDTALELADFINNNTSQTLISGVDMSSYKSMNKSQNMNTVQVTSFS
jgi:hypothetical protein